VAAEDNKPENRWLVVLRGDPDTDHIVAGVSHAASRGQLMTLLVVTKPTEQMLARIRMLSAHSNVAVEFDSRLGTRYGTLGKIGRIRHRRSVVKQSLERNRISLVIHEWWDGIAGADRKMSLRLRAHWFADFPTQLQFAAQALQIPVVALPHGHAMKELSIGSTHARKVAELNAGRLPFGNRESFAAYVVAHPTDCEFLAQRTEMSAKNIAVWGSARFSSAWVSSLYATVVPFRTESNARKVLFFLPKWHNMIDRVATLDLLSALGKTEGIELWIREHSRKNESGLNHDERQRLAAASNAILVKSDIDSASLISGCDVMVEIESSIAIDAVFLGKRVVMPRYLQDSTVASRLDRTSAVIRTHDMVSTIAATTELSLAPAVDNEFLLGVAAQLHTDTLAFYDQELRAIELAGGKRR
jgi:hypothetical protein